MNTITTFFFDKNLKYLEFITEATKLLHHNTTYESLCIPIAHFMWHYYKIKKSNYPQISVTINPKDLSDIKVPSCSSHWILCEYLKNCIAYPSVDCKSMESLSKKTLAQIYRTTTNSLPLDFEYSLAAAINNPVNSINNLYTYKSSKVVLEIN